MGICNSSTKEDVRRDRERVRAAEGRGGGQQHAGDGRSERGSSIPGAAQAGRLPPSSSAIPTGSYRDSGGGLRAGESAGEVLAASFRQGGVLDEQYGSSYAQRKTKEYDILNDIVKQTRNNFIDVSSKPGTLDDEDLIERGNRYVRILSEMPASATQSALGAPSPFGKEQGAMELPLPCASVIGKDAAATAAAPSRPSNPSALSSLMRPSQSASSLEVDYGSLVRLLSSASLSAQDAELIAAASTQLTNALLDSATVQEPPPQIVLSFEELLAEK